MLSLLLFVSAGAQCLERIDTIGVEIFFRQGHSMLDTSYQKNGMRLDMFVRQLQNLQQDTLCHVRRVLITSGSSPEGSTSMNKRLSRKRADQISLYLKQHTSLSGSHFDISANGIDWQGLEQLVLASDMPHRKEVLDILQNTPEWVVSKGLVVDSRKRQLGMLHGGQTWNYMSNYFFSKLRKSSAKIICEVIHANESQEINKRESYPIFVQDTVYVNRIDTVFVVKYDTLHIPTSQRSSCKPFYMAIKTNLLYDALLVPNIGVEFYLGKGWSVAGNWMYAWWKSDRSHHYWRVYGGDLEVRRYFGQKAEEKPFTGHHIGLYGQILTYDFELGGRGYMGGRPGGSLWEKANYGVGLAYGYSLPVSRRLNLDFSLGLGYLGGTYYEYVPMDGHYVWERTKTRHWFGATKAEVSLVWLLGRGNYNKKKGDKQ